MSDDKLKELGEFVSHQQETIRQQDKRWDKAQLEIEQLKKDLAEARLHAERWCRISNGLRTNLPWEDHELDKT